MLREWSVTLVAVSLLAGALAGVARGETGDSREAPPEKTPAARALELEAAGRFAEAVEAWCGVVKSLPEGSFEERASAKEGLGRALAALGLYSEATVWARSALGELQRAEAKGLDAEGRKRIVLLLLRLGEYDSAIERSEELARSAGEPEPVRLWARQQSLNASLRQGDWRSAADKAAELEKLAPESAMRLWALLKLAEARGEMRDFAASAQAYRLVESRAEGDLAQLASERAAAAEAVDRLYSPVRELTLALASDRKGEVTLVFSGRGSRRVRPVAELASWGDESPAAMDEFERRSAELLRMLASELAARRSAARPIFGVTVALIAPDPALGRSPSPGVVVTAVDPGSPAEKMGLARGDVIVSVNGLDLGEGRLAVERLSAAVRSAGPGGAVSVTVTRGKGTAVVAGKLAEY